MLRAIYLILFTVFCSSLSLAKNKETFKLCTDLDTDTEIFFSKMFVPNKGWLDCEKIDKNSRSEFKKPEDLINIIKKRFNRKREDLVYCATRGQSANDNSANYWMVRIIKKNCSGKYYENVKYIGNNTWQINYGGKSFPEKIAKVNKSQIKPAVSKNIKMSEKASEKITREFIDYIFIEEKFKRFAKHERRLDGIIDQNNIINAGETIYIERLKTSIKRNEKRNKIAQCIYKNKGTWPDVESCSAKVIKNLLKKSELGKKRKPGEIFYVLDAVSRVLIDEIPKVVQVDKFDEIKPGMRCYRRSLKAGAGDFVPRPYYCPKYKDKFLKKLKKFEEDPSNEKVLGSNVVKYINNKKLLYKISEKLGETNRMWTTGTFLSGKYYGQKTDVEALAAVGGRNGKNFFSISDYSLIGDALNDLTGEVKKNKLRPEIKKRRILLKKYSIHLQSIKSKLLEENYKKIDKDIKKLSSAYDKLKQIDKGSINLSNNFDIAIKIIFDSNELIIKSISSKINNNEDKLFSLALINFVQSLTDSIMDTLPEKYTAETKPLNKELFNKHDLASIENFISRLEIKKKEKIKELKKGNKKIDKYINTSDVLRKLNKIGVKNVIEKEITIDSASKTAQLQAINSLSSDIIKGTKSIIEKLEESELSDMSEELNQVASEVASDPSIEQATEKATESWLDEKIGSVTLRNLIGVGAIGPRNRDGSLK